MSQYGVLVLMGVSGAGKTAVGHALAARLGWTFVDADDLHPPENVAKMQRGEGLTDADRAPWLEAVRTLIETRLAVGTPTVLACSALKARYRAMLRVDDRVQLVWLDVPRAVLEQRLRRRTDHFAGVDLLPSQLAAFERPAEREAVRIAVRGAIAQTVQAIIETLRLAPAQA